MVTYVVPQITPVTFQMLNSHMWLVDTILDGTDTENFIRQHYSRNTLEYFFFFFFVHWSIFKQNYTMSRWKGRVGGTDKSVENFWSQVISIL